MSIVLPIHGQTTWDTPLDLALRNIAVAGVHPNDFGYQVWTSDPGFCTAGDGLVSGTVRMIKLPLNPQTYTITSIKYFVGTAAVTPTAGQNFAGIYNAAGTRVAVTADVTADVGSIGMKTFNLTAPLVVAANTAVWVAILCNAGTALASVGTAAVAAREGLFNPDQTAATARFTSGPAGQTSLPASITMGTRTILSRAPWVAVA